jgi:hypothetical protein
MNLRDYKSTDRADLEAMQRAQGFDYKLPDLNDPRLWIARRVMVDEKDRPTHAILGRLTSEAYYLNFPRKENPITQMKRFLSMHEIACAAGKQAGLDSCHIWIPPEIKETFGPQLERLGWVEYTWATFSKQLGD